MYYQLNQSSEAITTTNNFTQFSSSIAALNNCGDINYKITPSSSSLVPFFSAGVTSTVHSTTTDSYFEFSVPRSETLAELKFGKPTSHSLFGTHSLLLEATLNDYPNMTFMKQTQTFELQIGSVCEKPEDLAA